VIAVLAAIGGDRGSGVEIDLFPWGLVLSALAVYVVAVAVLLAAGRRDDARAVAGFLPDCAVMIGRLARDPHVSRLRRLALLAVVAYLAMPLDLIPDFLPGPGHLDDAVVLVLALRVLVRGATPEMLRAAWPGPEASLRLVLRAAGHEANGRGTIGRQAARFSSGRD
jgi:uncharacterized membrane protein YkvA (DUF1232 family)